MAATARDRPREALLERPTSSSARAASAGLVFCDACAISRARARPGGRGRPPLQQSLTTAGDAGTFPPCGADFSPRPDACSIHRNVSCSRPGARTEVRATPPRQSQLRATELARLCWSGRRPRRPARRQPRGFSATNARSAALARGLAEGDVRRSSRASRRQGTVGCFPPVWRGLQSAPLRLLDRPQLILLAPRGAD